MADLYTNKEIADNLTWNLRTQEDVENVKKVVEEMKSQCIEIIKEFMSNRLSTESECCIHSAKLMLAKTDDKTIIELHVSYDENEVFTVPVGETDGVLMDAYLNTPIGHYINIDSLMKTFADSRGFDVSNGRIWHK